eukprot:2902093-Rhodomonas_salina.3
MQAIAEQVQDPSDFAAAAVALGANVSACEVCAEPGAVVGGGRGLSAGGSGPVKAADGDAHGTRDVDRAELQRGSVSHVLFAAAAGGAAEQGRATAAAAGAWPEHAPHQPVGVCVLGERGVLCTGRAAVGSVCEGRQLGGADAGSGSGGVREGGRESLDAGPRSDRGQSMAGPSAGVRPPAAEADPPTGPEHRRLGAPEGFQSVVGVDSRGARGREDRTELVRELSLWRVACSGMGSSSL